MPEADPTLPEDMATMRELARDAGGLAMSFLAGGRQAENWQKTGGSPVTEADIAVNDLCALRLREARPDYGWLSEETADNPAKRRRQRCWVVDPIDGTRAYIDGDPYWCIGLSVVERGVAVAGVIYAPALDQMYEARLGAGAFLNGSRICVSAKADAGTCRLIAAARTHKRWPGATLANPKPNATLLRMAFVATGEWDAAVVLGRKSDWDLAAGAVLVTEAGGIATTHLGEPFLFNRQTPAQRSVIAAGKALHPLLVEQVSRVKLPDPQAEHGNNETNDTEPSNMGESSNTEKQLLHIVIGGELKDVRQVEFEDLSALDFVGAYPNYAQAYDAWKNAAHRTVDNAEMRYFILHAHRLLDPETGDHHHV